ncbi:MAG: 2-oxoacid:ferredoxin oxidoreductase subunit beta, partial [Candidatus Marinimicrobia bacterium]|nr:2-oxoacid:ferredoxin oxidoreductase subunit beta [Candidatus Neomarinimicrobiota bacterium]
NCNIFNDGAFAPMTDKETKADTVLWLENKQPMLFGAEKNKGIRLDGNKPIVIKIGNKWSVDDVLVHDESDYVIASLLSNLTYQPDFPDPIGVLYAIDSETYEDSMVNQINSAIEKKGTCSVQDILDAGDTWVVE